MKTIPYLIHYGVKGMKWGVRRQRKKYPVTPRRAALAAEYYRTKYGPTEEQVSKIGKTVKYVGQRSYKPVYDEHKNDELVTIGQKFVRGSLNFLFKEPDWDDPDWDWGDEEDDENE